VQFQAKLCEARFKIGLVGLRFFPGPAVNQRPRKVRVGPMHEQIRMNRIPSFRDTRARSPLSPDFLRKEDDEPGKLRRGQIGDAAGDDGRDAIWLRFFGFRPKQKGNRWKDGDRYDGRAHEGGCILGQHVARSHSQIRHRDDKRQRGSSLDLRRAQLAAAGAAQVSQLALFATLHDDRRPPAERAASGRYLEPRLFGN
jgi:hypothetical protein